MPLLSPGILLPLSAPIKANPRSTWGVFLQDHLPGQHLQTKKPSSPPSRGSSPILVDPTGQAEDKPSPETYRGKFLPAKQIGTALTPVPVC